MANARSGRLQLLFLSFSAQLTMDMIAMAAPLLALSLSASPFEIGLLATSRGIAYAIFPFFMGRLSDRVDRKPMLASSMSIYAAVAILFNLSKNPIELIALRFFEGLAMSIFWPTIEPLFVKGGRSKVSESLRWFNLSWGLGQIAGPFIGGILITAFGIRSPFQSASLLAIANLALIIGALPAGAPSGDLGRARPDEGALPPSSLIFINVTLGAILSIFFAFFPALGIRAGFSALEVGSLLLLFGIARLAAFHRAPSMKMGLGPRLGLASLGLILISTGDRAAMCLGAITTSAAVSLIYAYSIERMLSAMEDRLGSMAGAFEGSLGVGFMIGPLLAGLFAGGSLSNAFLAASILSAAAIPALRFGKGPEGRAARPCSPNA